MEDKFSRRELLIGMGAAALAYSPISNAMNHECRACAEACEATVAAIKKHLV